VIEVRRSTTELKDDGSWTNQDDIEKKVKKFLLAVTCLLFAYHFLSGILLA
jgi:hypothetical protein